MSRFLEAVEQHLPSQNLDELVDAKRTLQRLLLSKDIFADAKPFEDTIQIKLPDGRIIDLQLVNVSASQEEEEGDASDVVTAIAGIPDKHLKGPGKSTKKLARAKDQIVKTATAVANNMKKQASV